MLKDYTTDPFPHDYAVVVVVVVVLLVEVVDVLEDVVLDVVVLVVVVVVVVVGNDPLPPSLSVSSMRVFHSRIIG